MENYVGVGSYQGRPCYVFQLTASAQNNDSNKKEAEFKVIANAMDKAFAAQIKALNKKKSPTTVPTPAPASNSNSSAVYVAKTAFLDVSTQLPVAVIDSQFIQEYVFASQPPAESVLPDRFAGVLKSTKEALAAPYRRK